MRSLKGPVLWLAALGLSVGLGASRAAVTTSTVQVTSGQAPYTISYILGQDISAGKGTMTVNIRKASDDTLVKSFSVSSDTALTQGAHTADVTWDGTTTAGSKAPDGTYYAEIVTTGSPVTQWTLLAGPTQTADSTGTAFDGRNDYGGDANRNPNSPYHNLFYLATRQSNASARTGVWVANADSSSNNFFAPSANSSLDFMSASVLPDDSVVLTGQNSGNVYVLRPDGNVAATYGAGRVLTRTMQAFGTADHPELFYIGGGGASGTDVCYIPDVSAYTSTSTPVKLALSTAFPGALRGIVVNKAKTAFWVSGALGTTAPYAFLYKYNITKDGTGNITGATRDTSFTYTDPAEYPTAANQRWLALSPDESVLWYAINEGTAPFENGNALVVGFNPNTGADLGANYRYASPSFNPEDVSVTSSGNLFVTTYPGLLTGSTANSVVTLAPPDNGSSDTTRSFTFNVTASTTNTITSGPTVSDLTYHSATVSWTTQFAAGTKLSYGTDTSYGTDVTNAGDSNTDHSVALDKLAAGTTYYYKVTSSQAGLSDATATGQFTTLPLTISNLQANAGASNATVTWTTSEPATTVLSYGQFAGGEDQNVTNTALTTSHRVDLTGLLTNTTYYFTAQSGWPGAPAVTSPEMSFTTNTSNLVTSEGFNATTTSATLSLKLASAATATVKYGTDAGALTSTASVSGNGSDSLTASFSGLSASTTYYYSVALANMSIGGRSPVVGTFTTPGTGGTATTITQNSPAALATASAYDLQLGGTGSLAKLAKQGVPAAPVTGPDLPTENYYSAVTAANGYMYVIGGANNSGIPQNTVYVDKINADGTLDTTTGWQATTPLPETRVFVNNQAAAYSGFVYLLGGSPDGSTATIQPNVWYARQNADGTLGAWQSATPLPNARAFSAIVAVQGHLIVTGGFNVADLATDFSAEIRPDGSVGPWNAVSPLDVARDFHRAVTDGRDLYALSGINDPATTSYAPLSPSGSVGDFQPGATLPGDQYAMAAGLLRGKVVVAAGRTTGNVPLSPAAINYAKIQQDGSLGFGFTTDSNVYPVEVIDLDAAAYNGRLYAAGGRQALNGTTPNAVKTTVVIPMQDDPFDNSYAYFGLLESGVIDLGGFGNLQHLTVSGSGLTASNIEVRYRFAKSANGTDAPVFSDWFTTSGADAAISGGARFVQYQVALKGDGSATPTVASIALTASVISTALPGDVDKNGTAYEKNDAILALKIVGGLVSATDPSVSFQNADVDGSGHVDMADASLIWRRANGK